MQLTTQGVAVFDLEQFLPYRLYQAAEKSSQGFSDLYRKRYGLNRTQWRVLFNIGQLGPLTAGQITDESGLEKSKVSRAVVKLEKLGWITRAEDVSDRRRQPIVLTQSGHKVFDDLRKLAADYQLKIEQAMGAPDMGKLLNSLRTIELVNE